MAEPDQAPPAALERAALLLDFDGTLVEIAEEPDAIVVPLGLPPLLARLAAATDGRLAIVSGRAIASLDRHLACSAFAVAGSHGLEYRLRGGRHVRRATPVDIGAALDAVKEFAAADPRLLVEPKPFGVALHYRRAPEQAESVGELMAGLAAATGLTLQPGKMVVELRAAGADKGDAVRALMAEPLFAGARPVFVGDDETDESAFRAAAELGGGGILVGPPRPTSARWRLPDVAATIAWLEQVAQR